MKRALVNVLERATSTAIQSFLASAALTNIAFDSKEAKLLQVSGLIAAGAAAQSILKNVQAYLASQGNGPDVSTFDDGGK